MIDSAELQGIGARLELLCSESRRELLLVAPFIKASVLDRLLKDKNEGVSLSVVTRWKPQEISAGVSDLEVFDLVRQNQGQLFLRQDLHAKYYRGDDRILVGSANVTGAALGWSDSSNLELLVMVPSTEGELSDFERMLWSGSVVVDDSIHDIMRKAAEQCVGQPILEPEPAWDELKDAARDLEGWVPVLRSPPDLYRAYAKDGLAELSSSSLAAARCDLAVLQPPSDLSENAFREVIAAMLVTFPVIQMVDECLIRPQRFGHVRDVLSAQLGLSRNEASEAWQTLIRWLRHFLPNRYTYSRPRYSEVMSRNNVIG